MRIEERDGLIAQQLENTGYSGSCEGLYRLQCVETKQGETAYTKTPIANGVPLLIANQIRDDGVEKKNSLAVMFFVGKRVSELCVIPSADLDSKIGAYLPPWFRPEIGKNSRAFIVDCIRAQSESVEETRIYTHTGIKEIDGKTVFLFPGGALTESGIDDTVKTELRDRLTLYDFTMDRDPERWDTFREFLEVAPHRVTFPLLAFAALAPLHEALRRGDKEPAFIMNLYGTTGAQKSTLAALTMNFFGARFNEKQLPSDFKATVSTLEDRGFRSKDILTVIDDLQPTAQKREEQNQTETAQRILRMYGDRQGRGRMNPDLSAKPSHPPRGNALITSERIPNVGQSGLARMLNVKLTPKNDKTGRTGDVNLSILTEVQHNKTHLNQVMTEFIQWLLPRYASLSERLVKRFEELRTKAQGKGHGRTTEAVAHLQTALEVWTDFLQDVGQMSADEGRETLEEAWEIFLKTADVQVEEIEESRPSELFCEALREMLLTNEVKVQNRERGKTDKEIEEEAKNGAIEEYLYHSHIGWEDKIYYYLLPEKTRNAIFQFYEKQGSHFPYTKTDLARMLREDEILKPGRKSNTGEVQVGNKKARVGVWWIYKSAIFKNEEESDK